MAIADQGALRATHRGFTLLELLVVLLLIGIILSFATLSVGDGGRAAQVEREARRFAALTGLAGEESILRGVEFGIRVLPDGYRFEGYDGEKWVPLEGDDIFRMRALPEGVDLQLFLEGLPVSLEESEGKAPQIVLFSSGERTPFELVVGPEFDGPRYKLVAPPLGELTVSGPLERS